MKNLWIAIKSTKYALLQKKKKLTKYTLHLLTKFYLWYLRYYSTLDKQIQYLHILSTPICYMHDISSLLSYFNVFLCKITFLEFFAGDSSSCCFSWGLLYLFRKRWLSGGYVFISALSARCGFMSDIYINLLGKVF